MITLDELQEFSARGWKMFPVFKISDGACVCRNGADCDSPGKHPMVHNGVTAATNDPMQVVWWFLNFPECNWAVATGEPSGIWVLDLDTHAHDGVASLREWLDANDVVLPETYAVHTGGGGWHYYFRLEQPMKNRTGVLPGVDVRGAGGYVLLPGSNHISGMGYSVANDKPVAFAPRSLVEFLRTAPGSGHGRGGTRRPGSPIQGLDHYLERGFTVGNRDNECYALACSLWRKHWNDPKFVEAAISDCWRMTEQGESPFPWSQAKRKIAEARKFIGKQREAEGQFIGQFGASHD